MRTAGQSLSVDELIDTLETLNLGAAAHVSVTGSSGEYASVYRVTAAEIRGGELVLIAPDIGEHRGRCVDCSL